MDLMQRVQEIRTCSNLFLSVIVWRDIGTGFSFRCSTLKARRRSNGSFEPGRSCNIAFEARRWCSSFEPGWRRGHVVLHQKRFLETGLFIPSIFGRYDVIHFPLLDVTFCSTFFTSFLKVSNLLFLNLLFSLLQLFLFSCFNPKIWNRLLWNTNANLLEEYRLKVYQKEWSKLSDAEMNELFSLKVDFFHTNFDLGLGVFKLFQSSFFSLKLKPVKKINECWWSLRNILGLRFIH